MQNMRNMHRDKLDTLLKGLKIPAIKSLYYVFVSLSFLKAAGTSEFQTPLNYLDFDVSQSRSKTLLPHLNNNLDLVFDYFSGRIKQLLIDICDGLGEQQAFLKHDLWAITEEFNMMLRCCLSILNFNEFDQSFVVEKCQILADVLCMLCVMDVASADLDDLYFSNLVSHLETCRDGVSHVQFSEHYISFLFISEHGDMFLPLRLSMLEVFLDELLVHRTSLHVLFVLINYASSNHLTSFLGSGKGDGAIIFEVISAHFLIFIATDSDLRLFISRPFCRYHDKSMRNSEIGLNTSLCLLHNPVFLSASKLLQSHLISTVSESMDVLDCSRSICPFFRPSQSLISAFERSIILYQKFILSVDMEYCYTGITSSMQTGNMPPENFESFLCSMTRNRLEDVAFKLNGSWNAYLESKFMTPRTDLLDSAIVFIKDNMFLLNKNSRVDIFSVLEVLVRKAFLDGGGQPLLQNVGEKNTHEIYFLACILKLMGVSFCNVTSSTHSGGNMGCLRYCNECESCMEYQQIIDVIGTFQQLEIMIPVQHLPLDLHSPSGKHGKCKSMFLHLYLLLSLCFGSGFDFLVEGCIFVVMMLINLFTLDEDLLGILGPLLDFGSICNLPCSMYSDMKKGNNLKSCVIIAMNFQKARKLLFRIKSDASEEDEENEEDLRKVFLKSVIKNPVDESEIDDLACFIDCKSGKDYSMWLKIRRTFKKRKHQTRKLPWR